jgi:phosphoribulokinase
MAVKTKAQILAEISSLLADNTTGDISAQDVRTVVNDITDSYEDIITAGTTSQYWRGDKTWQTLPTVELSGSLTAAQINALDTTPINLLGAPGANKYYVIDQYILKQIQLHLQVDLHIYN